MYFTEEVNENSCRRDPYLSGVNVENFLPSDGGESDYEDKAHSFDFDTGSWVYKKDDRKISSRLIILQNLLNQMINKKNQSTGKENTYRPSPILRSASKHQVCEKDTKSEGYLTQRNETESERVYNVRKGTGNASGGVYRSNIKSSYNLGQVARSQTVSSGLLSQLEDKTSTAPKSQLPLTCSNLVSETPMTALFTEDDSILLQLCLSSLRYKDELFHTSKIYKSADTSEPGSESLQNLFRFLLQNLPPQKSEDEEKLSKAFFHLSKFEKKVLDKTVTCEDIIALYDIMHALRGHPKLDQGFLDDFENLTQELRKSFGNLANKEGPSEEQNPQAIREIHMLVIQLMGRAFDNLFGVYFRINHIENLLNLKVKNRQNLLEEALDSLKNCIKGFSKLLKTFDTSLEKNLEIVIQELEALKVNKNDFILTFELKQTIRHWHLAVQKYLLSHFTEQYDQEYPEQKELSDFSSSYEDDQLYQEKRRKDIEIFAQRTQNLLEKLLQSDSFLVTDYVSANRELLLEFYLLYKNNVDQKTRKADKTFENQLQRKNICTAEIEFTFDENVQISIPLYQPQKCVFNYSMLEFETKEYLDDITLASALKHTSSLGRPLYYFESNLHHSEKAVVGFVEENACTIVGNLLTKLGNQKENLKKLTKISLNFHSLRSPCETCTILLSHKFPKLFMRIYEEIKKHIDLAKIPEELKKMTKRIGFTSFPYKIPRLQGTEVSLLVKEDQMSFMNYEFLKRALLLTQDSLKLYRAKRTYFVSAPSSNHEKSLDFYQNYVLPLEIQVAEKLNEDKLLKTQDELAYIGNSLVISFGKCLRGIQPDMY